VAIIQQTLLHYDAPFQNTWISFYGPKAKWFNLVNSSQWWNSPGSVDYSWTVPNGVNSIHAVAIANGGAAENTSSSKACWGGEGGALAYGIDIPVSPGETLTLVVPPSQVGGNARNSNGGNWSDGVSFREWSYEGGIKRGSTWLIRAGETHYGQDNMQTSSQAGTLYSQGAISGTELDGGGKGGWCNSSGSTNAGPTPGCSAAGWSSDSPQQSNHTINRCNTGAVVTQCADGSGISGTPPTELNVAFTNDTWVNCADLGTNNNGYRGRWNSPQYYYTHNFGDNTNHISATYFPGLTGNKLQLDSNATYADFGFGAGGHHCGTGCAYKGHTRYSGGAGLIRIGY